MNIPNRILLCIVVVLLVVMVIVWFATGAVTFTFNGVLAFITLAIFIILGGLIEYIWFSKFREKRVVRAVPAILLAVTAAVSALNMHGSYAMLTMYVLTVLGLFGSIIIFAVMLSREKAREKKEDEEMWQ